MAWWFGRKVTVIVGGGGTIAALIFLLGALVYREWIPPTAGKFLWGAIAAAYTTYGPGYGLMVLGIVGVLILHERMWLYFIAEKNREIQRVVEQRNRLEEIILKNRGSTGGPKGKKK